MANRIGEVGDRRNTIAIASLRCLTEDTGFETENSIITSNRTVFAPLDTTVDIRLSTGFDIAIPEHNTVGYIVPVHKSAITDTIIQES